MQITFRENEVNSAGQNENRRLRQSEDAANTEKSILKVLVYFDFFKYPLTKNEIHRYLDKIITSESLEFMLEKLKESRHIWMHDEFFSLQNDYALVERRRNGNKRAAGLLIKARKISRLLYKFPYVRAIGISGSLSKNFADETADIDYFIITKANRLWIARTLMHLFKKLPFLKKRSQFYCMNYYIDEAQLLIEEKNVFTATELVTLMPVEGNGIMKRFFDANEWALSYFPNVYFPEVKNITTKEKWLKKIGEVMFNNKVGNWLDDYLMRLTTKRWKLKEQQGRLNTKGERMGLKTSKHFSKPNPIFFHDHFMSRYEKNLEEMKLKWKLQ